MRVWQVALVLAIALGLVLGVVLPGFAAPDKPGTPENKPPLRMLKGSVVSLDEGQEFFVIETGMVRLPYWLMMIRDILKYPSPKGLLPQSKIG